MYIKGMIWILIAWMGLGILDVQSEEMAGNQRIVVVSDAKIFMTPDENATEIDTLKTGESLLILSQTGEWFAVKRADDRLGWVHQGVFEEKPDTADKAMDDQPLKTEPNQTFKAIAQKDAPVRELNSDESRELLSIRQGDTVDVKYTKENWYFVQLPDGKTGWTRQDFFQAQMPQMEIESPPASERIATDVLFAGIAKVTRGRVRETPSQDGAVLFIMKKNTEVSVTQVEGEWYFIKLEDGRSGWGHESLFKIRLIREINDIQFETAEDGSEKLSFVLNGFFPPNAFAMEEDLVPKVVCDFLDTVLVKKITVIETRGKLIQKVRIGVHPSPRYKTRIVADLNPDQKYGVEQLFLKKSNLYTLTFKPLQKE